VVFESIRFFTKIELSELPATSIAHLRFHLLENRDEKFPAADEVLKFTSG